MLGFGTVEVLIILLVVLIPVGIVLFAVSLVRRFIIAYEKRTELMGKEKS